MKYPLLSVLWTLTDEPRIIKSALFKPSNPADRKPLVMPVNYWRFEVLKPILGRDIERFPNAVKNHFCPLFWLSNFAPIWLLYGLLAWILGLVKKAFMAVCDAGANLIESIRDGHREDKKTKWLDKWMNKMGPEDAFEFVERLHIWSPKELEKCYAKLFLDEGEKWDWNSPNPKTIQAIINEASAADFKDNRIDTQVIMTLQMIGLRQRHGKNWRKELKAQAEKYQSEREERRKKQEAEDAARAEADRIFSQKIAKASIWAKRIGTWILWLLTIPAVWAACWLAYWLYVFVVWALPILGGYAKGFWDILWNLFAYHTPTILLSIVGVVALWVSVVLIYNLIKGCLSRVGEWLTLDEAEEDAYESPQWIKSINSGIHKFFHAIGAFMGLMVDIVKLSYNNNCPAIERAKVEEDQGKA